MIESEIKREKYLGGGPEGAPSTRVEAERSAISDLQSVMRGDRAIDDDDDERAVVTTTVT